jgi:hypothetical protein
MKKKTTSKKPPLTTKRSKSGTKKSQEKNGLPDSNSLTSAKNTLAKWRQLFADGLPGPLEVRPPDQDSPIAVLLRHVDAPLFFSLSSERPPDSIQEDLIEIMKTSGVNDIEDQYAEARRSARGILFNCATKQAMRYLKDEDGDLDKALYRALLIEDPNFLYSSEKVSEFLADGIVSRGFKFLKRLAEDFKNAENRIDRLGVDDQTWIMAANWTNPHCPLWLMERPAIFQACKVLSPRTEMRQHAFNNRLKREGFKRSRSTPIVATRARTRVFSISGYEVKGSAFTSLHGKAYRAPSFQSSGYKIDARKK